MQKLFFLVLLTILSLFVVLPTHAQEPASIKTIIQEESITTEDLGVPEPTLLPSSPFYFLKEWTRGIQKALSFNPIKKAGLEVRFADEKIAEAKKLAAVAPERIKAISKALENYRSSQTRLKAELASLKQTSQNPEVDKLIEKIADRAVRGHKRQRFKTSAVR
ncbi:MAG: hypothetical protein HY001_01245 [Candidatus Portnoybacteria bacterium]|nr:hypothetical protein [Candidatus Portnoybacteria bacterium]